MSKNDSWILIIAFIWFSITAYFNEGYYHPDEHYQIIEFAQLLDGKVSGEDLPWEFKERIRPSLQPVICFLIIKVCDFLSINDHFAQAFILRLLTGFLSVVIIYLFAKSWKQFIPKSYWKFFLILSYFLWFIPLINVRFSSETWSGLLLMTSVVIAVKENKVRRDFLLLGILGYLSFLFRYQTAFASIGLVLWLFIIQRNKIANFMPYICGLLIIAGSGIILDTWYYGEFTIAPWRYFNYNILNDVASIYGTSPWYHYFYYVFRFSFFPFGIVIICSFLIVALTKSSNILIWIIIPFLLVHSLIPHKELRFLFPLINFVPALVIFALSEIDKKQNLFSATYLKILVSGFLVINLLSLMTSNLKPADKGRIAMTKTLNKLAQNREITLFCTFESNPLCFKGISSKYYDNPKISFKDLNSLNNSHLDEISVNAELAVVMVKDLNIPEIKSFIEENHFRKTSQSIPEFFIPFLKLYGGYKVDEILILYERAT